MMWRRSWLLPMSLPSSSVDEPALLRDPLVSRGTRENRGKGVLGLWACGAQERRMRGPFIRKFGTLGPDREDKPDRHEQHHSETSPRRRRQRPGGASRDGGFHARSIESTSSAKARAVGELASGSVAMALVQIF